MIGPLTTAEINTIRAELVLPGVEIPPTHPDNLWVKLSRLLATIDLLQENGPGSVVHTPTATPAASPQGQDKAAAPHDVLIWARRTAYGLMPPSEKRPSDDDIARYILASAPPAAGESARTPGTYESCARCDRRFPVHSSKTCVDLNCPTPLRPQADAVTGGRR